MTEAYLLGCGITECYSGKECDGRGRVPIVVPGLSDLKRSFFVQASDHGMQSVVCRVFAARDSL